MQAIFIIILFVVGVINHLKPKAVFIQQIKYDLRDRKILLIVAISVTEVLVLAVIGVALASHDIINTLAGDVCAVVFLGWPIAVVFWADYINCVFYLMRLRRNGYELPERKQDYGKQLSGLSRAEGNKEKTEGVCGGSQSQSSSCGRVRFYHFYGISM